MAKTRTDLIAILNSRGGVRNDLPEKADKLDQLANEAEKASKLLTDRNPSIYCGSIGCLDAMASSARKTASDIREFETNFEVEWNSDRH